jgi:hypothetical protein
VYWKKLTKKLDGIFLLTMFKKLHTERGRTFVQFLLPFFLLFIFFFLLLIGVRNQSHSWYFQDETEHVTVGWMITEFSRQLYGNLSTNHQPLPVLVGGLLAKVIPYSTFFQFIDRLRMSMWLFALITSFAVVVRYRWKGLWAVLFTYSIGHYFFAWHVLADALVIPAVLWIVLGLIDKKQHSFDHIIFGVSAFWITFNLLPLWPFVLFTWVYYVWLHRQSWKRVMSGFLVPTFFLFLMINPIRWWQETVMNNVLYFIPYEGKSDVWHYFRLLTYPFLHLKYLGSPVARLYVFGIALMGAWLIHLKNTSTLKKKDLFNILMLAIGVFLLNPRVSEVNASLYSGFHVFPYVAGMAVFMSVAFVSLFSHFSSSKKMQSLIYLLCTVVVIFIVSNLGWVREKRDKMSDYYIQYDTFQAYGTALKTIASPGDTLLTGPDGAGYMNMMAGLPLAGKQNFHLEWAYRVPYLREEWIEMVKTTPPTFLYYDLGTDSYSQVLAPLVNSNYVVLHRTDGTPTLLRMKKDAVEKVTAEQWKKFEDQSFRRPTQK